MKKRLEQLKTLTVVANLIFIPYVPVDARRIVPSDERNYNLDDVWEVVVQHCAATWTTNVTVVGHPSEFTRQFLTDAARKLGSAVSVTTRSIEWVFKHRNWNNKQFSKVESWKAKVTGSGLCFVIATSNLENIKIYFDSVTEDNMQWGTTSRLVVVEEATEEQCVANPVNNYYTRLFQRFLEKFKIFHVLLVRVCSNMKGAYVLTYNPFVRQRRLSSVDVKDFDVESTMTGTKRYWNFEGQRLVVTMFPQFPTALPKRWKPRAACKDELSVAALPISLHVGKHKYWGTDSSVAKALVATMNFEAQIRLPLGQPEHGVSSAGGTATGALADVITGVSDISLNPRLLTDLGTPEAGFLLPAVSQSSVCVLVPRASLLAFYKVAFRAFSTEVWLVLAACFVVSVCFWYGLYRLQLTPYSRRSWLSSVGEVTAFFLNLPVSHVTSMLPTSSRCFASSCLLFSLIMVSAYQGTLVKLLISPEHEPEIDSLEALDASGLPVAVSSSMMEGIFSGVDSPLWQRLASKTMIAPTYYLNKGLFVDRNLAVIPESDAPEGRAHRMKDCLAAYPTAYVVPRESPYKEQFGKVIGRLLNGGLVEYWTQDTLRRLTKSCVSPSSRMTALSVEDLNVAFYTLVIGLALSTVVFVAETIHNALLIAARHGRHVTAA